jgi:hypothetical protein
VIPEGLQNKYLNLYFTQRTFICYRVQCSDTMAFRNKINKYILDIITNTGLMHYVHLLCHCNFLHSSSGSVCKQTCVQKVHGNAQIIIINGWHLEQRTDPQIPGCKALDCLSNMALSTCPLVCFTKEALPIICQHTPRFTMI